MLIIFMDAQCQSLFQRLSFKSIDIEGFYLNKFSDDSQNVYQTLLLNVLKNYIVFTMVILQLLKKLDKKRYAA